MSKKKNRYSAVREPRVDLEDLRDDTIAVVLNSGMTFRRIQEEGGPTKSTLSKWLYKETRLPRLDTVRSILKICGHDLAVVPKTGNPLDHDEMVINQLRPTTTLTLPTRKSRVPVKAVRASKKRKVERF